MLRKRRNRSRLTKRRRCSFASLGCKSHCDGRSSRSVPCTPGPFFLSYSTLLLLFLLVPIRPLISTSMNGHAQQDYFASKPLPPPARDDLPPIPPVNEPDNTWTSRPQPPPKFGGDSSRGYSSDMMNGPAPIDPSALGPNDGARPCPWSMQDII